MHHAIDGSLGHEQHFRHFIGPEESFIQVHIFGLLAKNFRLADTPGFVWD